MEIPEDITIPPPSIKEIIHKTAKYVARNGKEFEEKIITSNSQQFKFIDAADDYHAYYEFALENIDALEPEEVDESEKIEKVDDLEFLVELPLITLKDLQIIKITAEFISLNDESFINVIKSKYDAAQFQFLDRSHSFHKVFLKYLKQYKLLLNEEIFLDYDLLEQVVKRAEYDTLTQQSIQSTKEKERLQKERYNSINWQDFVVIETIEITDVDKVTEFEEPFTKDDLQLRSLTKKSKQVSEYTSSSTKKENGIKIKEFGARRTTNLSKDKLIECPITGKLIPESQFQKHIQILLRDPNFKEERMKYESKIKNSNLTNSEVIQNIKSLFKKPVGSTKNENKRQKVTWDGYRSSVDFVKSSNSATKDDQEEYKRKQDSKRNDFGPQLPTK